MEISCELCFEYHVNERYIYRMSSFWAN
uniref:Uncharacterized protein n=1 Tax=Arundo donax TaxID=35708 RepID=A0A0A9ALP6_ARUDO